jgi:hypothetical protein
MNDTHSVAMHLFHVTSPRLDYDDCENVLGALNALGFRLESGDATSREAVGHGQWVELAKAVTRIAPIGHNQVLAAFTGISHLQYRIRRPKDAA